MRPGALAGGGVLVLLLAGVATPSGPPGELTLERLTRGMASSRGVVARFREVKELALLDAPLESRGTLYFVPPDRLLRVTTSPDAARLVVAEGRMHYRDAAGTEDVDLAASPVARHFVDNLIVLFNGDLPALRERYEIEFTPNDGAWQLVLTPRQAAMRRFIARIVLAGDGAALERLVTTEADGDRTTTTFHDVVPDHPFAPDELRRLFEHPDP